MNKLPLIAVLTFYSTIIYSQQDIFVYKKRDRTLEIFSKDSYIAFQLKNKDWIAGYITRVQNDSFYLRPTAVLYGFMRIDTLRFNELPFALTDVYAMPKDGFQIDYIDGRFQINTGGGHVHWYWVKGGWIFRTGGAGYILLNATNGLIHHNFTLANKSLGIAAAVFLFGELLHLTYRPTHRLAKKYHLQFIKVSEPSHIT